MAITLKAARINAGLKQTDVTCAVSVNASTLSRWENGKAVPDAVAFMQLCKLYGVNPNDIFLPINCN